MKSKMGVAGIAVGMAAYVDKYNLTDVPGMTLDDLADPELPWEVFFWTAR